jgi:hypothetical protein
MFNVGKGSVAPTGCFGRRDQYFGRRGHLVVVTKILYEREPNFEWLPNRTVLIYKCNGMVSGRKNKRNKERELTAVLITRNFNFDLMFK